MKRIWNEPKFNQDFSERIDEISKKFNTSELVSKIIAKKEFDRRTNQSFFGANKT